ncbi:hypothetical protein J1G42_04060 [Cellulomonas sp. zg-ZUI222]|uniref:Uncharacterized protein n=1 Tax=Cellulomonas wangleii TaxID=2816956 RepID=A0ABX8D370_9CELL|nr:MULTISPECIES: hypothetical protein [Cellulomonas]MBO0899146.1 hypothetical protein [Cellulomonas sp. zg-ZUI22]MBO0919996.1 hypothetical protein [Cellulomonas wangleii]MBO0923575.1 hypothetical protein [Cellulomonas wangleii]QVI61905.1 hypothetical protein KG103_15935 [Cellulomonas wangleii]
MTSGVEPLHELRLARRALRAERDRVAWWRRAVRARMDLAVAAAASPGTLGEQVAFLLPLDVCLQVPRPDELGAALPPGDGHDLGRLPDLRALDTRLAAYEQGVVEALDRTTARLVERLAGDPSAALRPRAPAVEGR